MPLKKASMDGQEAQPNDTSNVEEVSQTTEQATDTPAQDLETISSKDMTAQTSGSEFSSRMSDQGFKGLEIGFGSFPIIKLANEGAFIDSEETDHGKDFVCQLLSTRPSYLFKQKDNSDSDVYYSYGCDDNSPLTTTTAGGSTTIAELREEWLIEGGVLETKQYLEAVIVMKGDSEFCDEMFLLSIAPNSRKKIAGLIAGMEFRNESVSDTLICCEVGKKRKHGSNTYFPWAFKVMRD